MTDIRERLQRLVRLEPESTPVVSVYLNTEWVDEHQRERVRVFLKNRLREVREAGGVDTADLDWIAAQSRALVDRGAFTDINGVALFACSGAELREIVPVRVPFEDTFVVEPQPYLRPLAGAIGNTPAALVVFIDGTTASLVALGAAGPEEAILLEADVEGRHRGPRWRSRGTSDTSRSIATSMSRRWPPPSRPGAWSVEHGAERIVLAGEARMVPALRRHLPGRVAARVVGSISGTRRESSAVLTARAAELLAGVEAEREDAAGDAVLTEAAGSGVAVAGLEPNCSSRGR